MLHPPPGRERILPPDTKFYAASPATKFYAASPPGRERSLCHYLALYSLTQVLRQTLDIVFVQVRGWFIKRQDTTVEKNVSASASLIIRAARTF